MKESKKRLERSVATSIVKKNKKSKIQKLFLLILTIQEIKNHTTINREKKTPKHTLEDNQFYTVPVLDYPKHL